MRVFETQTVSLENVYCLIYVYSTLEYCIQSNTVISMQYTVYSIQSNCALSHRLAWWVLDWSVRTFETALLVAGCQLSSAFFQLV